VFRNGSLQNKTACTSYVEPWLVAVGGWWLVAVGGWSPMAVGGWRLVAVAGWRLVVPGGGPERRPSAKKKKGFLKDRPENVTSIYTSSPKAHSTISYSKLILRGKIIPSILNMDIERIKLVEKMRLFSLDAETFTLNQDCKHT
jgi:hypothetical protein